MKYTKTKNIKRLKAINFSRIAVLSAAVFIGGFAASGCSNLPTNSTAANETKNAVSSATTNKPAVVTSATPAVSTSAEKVPVRLAKITPEQAKSAALAQISGTVKSVQLENEGGSVVYAVEIQIADGGIREVLVDGGSGQVLPEEND